MEMMQKNPQGENLISEPKENEKIAREGTRGSALRQLNPALFGETGSQTKVIDGTSANSQLPQLMHTEQKIHELKGQISVVADHLGKWSQNYVEFVQGTQHKFDKIQQVLIKLENNDQHIVNEAAQKFARVNDRFAERKSVDSKIQEMIDRHNSVLRSFEMRMNQMQKLLAEKEASLLSAQAALNEAKMEISRLKRL